VATVLDGFQVDPDIFIPFGLAYTIVGGLIAARHPENAIGWLLLAGLFTLSANELILWYAKIGFQSQPGTFPLVNLSAALTNALENIGYALLLIFPFLLFPNGRLLSMRWLPILWLAVFTQLMQFIEIFRPGPLVNLPNWENPLGIERMAGYFEISGTLIEILTATLFFISTMLLILRYRRATIIERQQIKWFAFVGGVVSIGLILSIFIFDPQGGVETVLGLSIYTSLLLAFAIAILRYNLWDIDLIIRRTLQYAILTGLLAFVYFGSVLVLQNFVENITGEQSPLVIVLSTLAIAALFNPLRHRIQNFIDRRFFRSKYDAAQTLARFASVARNEVDMETLITAIFAMVNETVHPKNISLWLQNYEDT
jgi:cytochrome b subunit of formate dehydrogenase